MNRPNYQCLRHILVLVILKVRREIFIVLYVDYYSLIYVFAKFHQRLPICSKVLQQ